MSAEVNQKVKWNTRFGTPSFRSSTHVVAGFGASVVIVGALFKIMHWKGCDTMLIIGLLTEAFIFGLYAIIQNQWDVLEGSVSVAIAAFIFFILWRNNFFTKSKS